MLLSICGMWPLQIVNLKSEKQLIFVGDKGVGKSSIIELLKNQKDNISKSNPLMDYQFVLGQKENFQIYEIGGGRNMKNLATIPLNKININNTILVIVVDISDQNQVIESLNFWTNYLKQQVNQKIQKVFQDDQKLKNNYLYEFIKKINQNKDYVKLNPILIQTIILANKFDQYEKIETKWLMRIVRSIAHQNGAALYHCQCKPYDKLSQQIKTVLRNYIYNIPNSLKLTDHNKPVFISELNDNFENMDLPKAQGKLSDQAILDKLINQYFPQKGMFFLNRILIINQRKYRK